MSSNNCNADSSAANDNKRKFVCEDDCNDDEHKNGSIYVEIHKQWLKYETMINRNNTKLLIRVYQGSIADCGGHQLIPFHRSTSILDLNMVRIEYCTISKVKKNNWKPNDLIDWLLESDVHFVLTHISSENIQMEYD